ncbi:hypothetical protein J6X09_00570 [Candidatus Saccharibacteria bacterium]|jgi:hypothetical protein|nr:hypothetical protein [Candidatus Saccharibacteria bacterium]
MIEEECAVFHLPTQSTTEAIETVASQPLQYSQSFSASEKISDQALFDELNAISEEVITCRNHILSKIS